MHAIEKPNACHLSAFLFVFISLVSGIAAAQSSRGEDDYTRGSIFARAMQVENATATNRQALQVEELQTRYGLTLEALRRSELTSLALDYELTKASFNEDSQAGENYWEGESQFNLGNETTVYELDAFHSSRRVLNTPGTSPLLLANSQDRVIYGVSPLLKLRLGDANSVALSYDFSEVKFGDSDSNDSARQGFDLSYTRFVSPIRALTLRISEREIDYETSDTADYDTQTLSVEMVAEHRTYDYELVVGVTEVSPRLTPDAKENTFVGDFILRSPIAGNVFTVFANRTVSDSSQGSGNASFFSTDITYDSAIAERDQVIRSSAGLGWANQLLCGRCELGINIGIEVSDFINRSQNDARQQFVDLNFSYDFSAQLSGRLGLRSSETDQRDASSVLEDADSVVLQAQLAYQFNRIFSLSFQHERDERSIGDDEEFVVSSTGITATLMFE